MDAPTLSKNKSYWFGEGSSKNVKISNVMEIEKAQRRFARRGKKLMKISLDEGHFPYEKMSTTFGSHFQICSEHPPCTCNRARGASLGRTRSQSFF